MTLTIWTAPGMLFHNAPSNVVWCESDVGTVAGRRAARPEERVASHAVLHGARAADSIEKSVVRHLDAGPYAVVTLGPIVARKYDVGGHMAAHVDGKDGATQRAMLVMIPHGDYDGGRLVAEGVAVGPPVRHDTTTCVLIMHGTVHEVTKVTRGTRYVYTCPVFVDDMGPAASEFGPGENFKMPPGSDAGGFFN